MHEIGNRKKHFKDITKDESGYFTINLKAREIYRRQKEKSIQEENDLFVERLVKNLSHKKGIRAEIDR